MLYSCKKGKKIVFLQKKQDMKTKEQILRQVKLCIFTDDEWKKVKAFFQKNYGTGIVKPFRGKYHYTLQNLQEWIGNGLGVGDMVDVNGEIRIVAYEISGDICFSAYRKSNGKFKSIDTAKPCVNCFPCRKIEGNEYWSYVRQIHKQGYNISETSAKILRRPAFRIGKMYRFVMNGIIYYGILKCFDENEAEMFYRFDGKDDFSTEKVVIPTVDVLDVITDKRLNDIEDDIAHCFHVRWSEPNKSLLCIPKRLECGKKYFYITDRFFVASAIDNRGRVANTRYQGYNYFSSMNEASEFLITVRALRAQQIKNGTIIL
mgnify:FL=1